MLHAVVVLLQDRGLSGLHAARIRSHDRLAVMPIATGPHLYHLNLVGFRPLHHQLGPLGPPPNQLVYSLALDE